jgi:hypothetical protein
MVKSLPTAICPTTMLNTIGYIYDNEKTAEVTSFLAENPRASSWQYTNDTSPNTPPVHNFIPRDILTAVQIAHLIGFSSGVFLTLSSALGAAILRDSLPPQEVFIVLVGVTITIDAWYFLKSVYVILYALNRDLRNYELAAILMSGTLAVLVSIPVGAWITRFEHSSIGLMMCKQLLGACVLIVGFLLIVGLALVFNFLCCVAPFMGYIVVTPPTDNLPEFVTRDDGSLIRFLPNYVEPTALVNAMETTASSTNRLELVSLNQGMYQAQRSVEQSTETASDYVSFGNV